jgi:hypothetical protein
MNEILIKTYHVDPALIYASPVGCPKADSGEILQSGDVIYCLHNEHVCPYLESMDFVKDSNKTLMCKGA